MNLADQRITVSDDSSRFAGDKIDGPGFLLRASRFTSVVSFGVAMAFGLGIAVCVLGYWRLSLARKACATASPHGRRTGGGAPRW